MPHRILLIGCGYVGLPLARRLQEQGHAVTGWVRSPESAAEVAGCGLASVVIGNVADETVWFGLTESFDAIVHLASSGGGGADAYREVFLEGVRRMNRHGSGARRLFVSSTSVYGQTDGSLVDEASRTEPASETSRVLRAAEDEALAAGVTVVRPAGIYGPGRAALWEKLRRGDAVLEGEGLRWMNQIHRLDLVEAIDRLLEIGQPGEIYNAADDEPVTQRDYYGWCCAVLRLPLPSTAPVPTQRKRGVTNKRVENRKLRAMGWAPRFPTFREGLATLDTFPKEQVPLNFPRPADTPPPIRS